MSSFASNDWFATRNTTGVSFSEVNTKLMATATTAAITTRSEAKVIEAILITLRNAIFYPI